MRKFHVIHPVLFKRCTLRDYVTHRLILNKRIERIPEARVNSGVFFEMICSHNIRLYAFIVKSGLIYIELDRS